MSRSAKLQLVLVAASLVFWGAILGWTLVAERGDPPDFLDDRTFPTAAEPICARTVAAIEALGSAAAVDTVAERARLVDDQDTLLVAMLRQLEALPHPDGEQGEWVTAWLDDWRTHLRDRERWAERLHAGEDPPFVETARGTDRVSEVVDGFAKANDMPSCATYADV